MDRYVRDVADRLGLRDWEIRLRRTPCEDGNGASVTVVYGRRLATMELCADFVTISADDRRHNITHELIHCHMDQCYVILRQLERTFGQAVYSVIREVQHEAIEQATDALATVIAPTMPACELPQGGD